jgi:glycosidase
MTQDSHANAQRGKGRGFEQLFAPLRLCVSLFLPALLFTSSNAQAERPVIYQLMVRHFGNTNETRKPHGTIAENGCGKFADINDAALVSLKKLGITHLWLTGVLQQATRTDYSAIGQPADDPDICKGQAGSPYAIKDYFDVCPDYARDPARRLDEFRELMKRCDAHGLRVILDFVPNHVARSYASDVRPQLSFGEGDDRQQFFSEQNHFYYLQLGNPPLRLPTAGRPGCDGLFDGEREFGRVTGNNAATWTPGAEDWYETVKLNYGVDFTSGRKADGMFENRDEASLPRTWRFMDSILAYWQEMGVDGFRCDMAHMVPMQFWSYAIKRARERSANVFFMAEAYDNDPAKLTSGNVLDALLTSGFDAVYDDPTYDLLNAIQSGPKWANDLDALTNDADARFHRSLRYGENHDEVRLANPREWTGLGINVGRSVCGLLFALGRGPVMIYNGQEVGEPALGTEGHGGDDGRTTIFDYWSMPEFIKWTNGHRYDGGLLSDDQKSLRDWYSRLLALMQEPAFTKGAFRAVNPDNRENELFGRQPGETASGHWLYSFLRADKTSGQRFLVIVNLHGKNVATDTRVRLSAETLAWLGASGAGEIRLADRLIPGAAEITSTAASITNEGVTLGDLPPLSATYYQLQW